MSDKARASRSRKAFVLGKSGRPLAKSRWQRGERLLVRCPVCGQEAEIQGFDALGAELDCLFCNNCQSEVEVA